MKKTLMAFMAAALLLILLPVQASASGIMPTIPGTAKLAAPSAAVTAGSAGKPVLKWNAVPGAAQYEVWRSPTGKSGSYSIIRRTAMLTYTDDKAVSGAVYYYRVRAMSGTTYSSFSAAAKIQTPPAVPTARVSVNSSGRPVVSWAKVSGASQYEVWRSPTGKSGSYSIVRRTATLTYTDDKAAPGTVYYYRVRAMSGSVYSSFSAEVKVQTVPAAPAVKLSVSSSGKPVVSWAKVSGASQYEVWRSPTGKSGSYSIVRRTAALTYTDDKAASGTVYYYRVRALNGAGAGSFSSAVSRSTVPSSKTPARVKMGTITQVTTGVKGVQLTWSAAANAVTYNVYRAANPTNGKDVPSSKWELVGKQIDGLRFKDTTGKSGTLYAYTVRGVAADGKTLSVSYNTYGLRITMP